MTEEKLLEYFKSDDIYLIQCEHKWCNIGGYEKSQMKKDILDYITNLQQENEFLKLNNPEMNIEHFRIIKENKRKIDNLRKQNKELKSDIEALEGVKNFYKRHSLKYYRRCDIALAWIEATKEIIKQQPTKDDSWILDKLNSFENILNGGDK